jgi:hypothetical protein
MKKKMFTGVIKKKNPIGNEDSSRIQETEKQKTRSESNA